MLLFVDKFYLLGHCVQVNDETTTKKGLLGHLPGHCVQVKDKKTAKKGHHGHYLGHCNAIIMKKRFLILLVFLTTIGIGFSQQIKPIPNLEIPKLKPNEVVIKHYAYSLSYNEPNEQANWVAYELTSDETNSTFKRANNYQYLYLLNHRISLFTISFHKIYNVNLTSLRGGRLRLLQS